MPHEHVILVDENNNPIGTGEKLQVHKDNTLHRAFSVFIFNDEEKVLLQRRALEKYHSPGLWTNTCCGHPRPEEETKAAAERRLSEEMGIDTKLRQVGSFIYQVDFESGLHEHEYDYVFAGTFNDEPKPDPNEVADWKWMDVEKFRNALRTNPKEYSYWVGEAIDIVRSPA